MEFTISINPQDNPNAVGELLRSRFFDEKDGFGCYTSFDWAPGVQALSDESVEDDEGMSWRRATLDNIECRWYWDHDGTLEFHFPDGSFLSNDDCKKDYRWEYYPAS